FLFFTPVSAPVTRKRLFLRYFNDLSCIWRAPTPCKSPVFFFDVFFTNGLHPVRHETRQTFASLHMRPPCPEVGEGAQAQCPQDSDSCRSSGRFRGRSLRSWRNSSRSMSARKREGACSRTLPRKMRRSARLSSSRSLARVMPT